MYKDLKLYCDPQICIIDEEMFSKMIGNKVFIQTQNTSMIHMSIKHNLKMLFEIDGLYNATLEYIKSLEFDDDVLSNFIQGSLWKDIIKNIDQKNTLIYL